MKQMVTYSELREIEADTRRLMMSPALKLFLGRQIVSFFSKNQQRLESLHEKIAQLVKKYVTHDEKGKPVTEKNKDGVEVYLFKDKETEELYVKDLWAFDKTSFNIEI